MLVILHVDVSRVMMARPPASFLFLSKSRGRPIDSVINAIEWPGMAAIVEELFSVVENTDTDGSGSMLMCIENDNGENAEWEMVCMLSESACCMLGIGDSSGGWGHGHGHGWGLVGDWGGQRTGGRWTNSK